MLGLQCRQCGVRFLKSADGQTKMDEHMDWHFRQRRKHADALESGKAYSREWFLSEEDWLAMLDEVDTTSRKGIFVSFLF
jgi:pre-mRNA cleavage complex 2 protein Pcf11